MIDAETKERLDEIEGLVRSQARCSQADAFEISVGIVLLFAAVLLIVVLLAWDWICARIAVNILGQLTGELPAGR